jgi:hypothetical protein
MKCAFFILCPRQESNLLGRTGGIGHKTSLFIA